MVAALKLTPGGHRKPCAEKLLVERALQFQGTKDKKDHRQIAALNRVLAKMDALDSDSSQPKNCQ